MMTVEIMSLSSNALEYRWQRTIVWIEVIAMISNFKNDRDISKKQTATNKINGKQKKKAVAEIKSLLVTSKFLTASNFVQKWLNI
jgi:hypothetical protein